jgi:CheY-like chemotaxis protein
MKLRKATEALGYHVATAESGPKALEILAQSDVDLILLDIVMPEMDGFEV